MDALLTLCLAVLGAFYIGVILGVMLGGMARTSKTTDDSGEHEANAPYRRFDE